MADYEKYRNSVRISNVQMTEVLREAFPSFSKIQASMVNAPEKYGLCLTPEAEAVLIANFGYGDGLNTKLRKNSSQCNIGGQNYRFAFISGSTIVGSFAFLILYPVVETPVF